MLQKLSDHIAHCLAQANVAELRASEASNQTVSGDYERLAQSWRHLASSYQFVETLERFLLDAERPSRADRARRAWRLDSANENSGGMFPPVGTAFSPETIAMLSTAYERAIDGQPTSAHEAIAKRIIELASEGVRDPQKLCEGALILSMRKPQSIA